MGDQAIVGRLVTTSSGQDNISLKALDGTNDRAYVFLRNLSTTSGEYVKVGLCSAHGTDSVAADWFAVLGPGEFMFMPTADMQDIDIITASGTPVIEYVLMEKA